jgi:hypothetical protein
MRRRELSERIERHMERGEELMELNRRELELNRAAAERNTQAFEQLMATFDRHEKAFDRHERAFERHEGSFERVSTVLDAQESRGEDLKEFIREINLKSEKLFQELLRRSDEATAEQRRKTDAILVQLRDVREESKAQTQALLALIDRLPPPAQAA